MPKALILKSKQLPHVLSEKQVLKLMNSPFVVEFVGTMQDELRLYCLMEFVPGGELFRYMCEKEKLTKWESQFYISEIVMAMCHLHAIRCAYRDLKPENIVLSASGHVKLVDFGFAKLIPRGEKTYTTCGTPEYIAPEVIERNGYDCSADWWQVGILLYEMLVGSTPFTDPSPYAMYESILSAPAEFPGEGFDVEAKDLISKLLRKDPKKRPTEEEILKHPFFKSSDWDDVRQLRLTPPFVPSLRSAEDTFYYQNFQEKEKYADRISPSEQEAFLDY